MSFYTNSPSIFTPPSNGVSSPCNYEFPPKSVHHQAALTHNVSTASSYSQISQGNSPNLVNAENETDVTQDQLQQFQYEQIYKAYQKQSLIDSPLGYQECDVSFSQKNQHQQLNLSKLNTCEDSDDNVDIFASSNKQSQMQQQQQQDNEDLKLPSPMFTSQNFPSYQQFQQISNQQHQQQQQQQQYQQNIDFPLQNQSQFVLQNDFPLNIKEESSYYKDDQQSSSHSNLQQQQQQQQHCNYQLIEQNSSYVKREPIINIQTDDFGDFQRIQNNQPYYYQQQQSTTNNNNQYAEDEFNFNNQNNQNSQQQYPHQQQQQLQQQQHNDNINNNSQQQQSQIKKVIKKKRQSISQSINPRLLQQRRSFSVKEENDLLSSNNSSLKRKTSNMSNSSQGKEKKPRINTSHVPLNMFNSLHMHLIKIYQKISCTCSSVSPQSTVEHNKPNYSFDFQYTEKKTCIGEQCRRCRDLEILTEIKKSQRKNIETFRNLWQNSVRIQKLTEHFLLYYSQTRFLSNTQYRSTQSANALYSCLPTFLDGSRNYLHFYKLQP